MLRELQERKSESKENASAHDKASVEMSTSLDIS